jgi:NRE family putative nickel resistance protein-like MFS transporter
LFPEDSYKRLLANRSFLALWLGQGIASLGQAILYVTLALYVYDLTGSAQGVSLAVALELLPWVVVGPIDGILADRVNRKFLLVGGYVTQAGLVALLPFTNSLEQVYVLIFLSSLPVPVSQITRATALPSVTGVELFIRGSSLDIAALNIAGVIGPVLGGWLLGVFGARVAFFIIAGCLLVAAVLSTIASVPRPEVSFRQPLRPSVAWRDLRAAATLLASSKVFRFLLLLNFVLSIGWTAPDVAAVVYLTDTLQLSGQEFGLLHATMSLSIALTVYVLGHTSRRFRRSRMLIGGAVLAGLAYTLILFEPGLSQMLIIWAVSGLGWGVHWLMDQTLWAEATPDETRGRVFSLAEAMVSLVGVVMALLGGWLIANLGPVPALAIIGLAMALGALALSLITKGYRAIAEVKPE